MTNTKQTVLTDLLDCCRAWEPSVRILGNVRAGDAAAAIEDVLSKLRAAGEPSDEELEALARQHGSGGWQTLPDMVRFARALLSRYAAPQASADPTRAMLEGKPLDSEFSKVLADNFDELCIRPATVDSAEGAGSVAQPKRRPYNASASLSEYGVFPECDAAPVDEAPAKGAGDVALPPIPESQGYIPKTLANGEIVEIAAVSQYRAIEYARAAVLADRQQRGGDAEEIRTLAAECESLAHQLNASNERNGALRNALSDCSAELFAQCGDQPRAMSYVMAARAALSATKGESNG